MNVLIIHDTYRYYGGEDSAVANDIRLLQSHGHTVRRLQRASAADQSSAFRAVGALLIPRISSRELAIEMADWKPDVVHLHGTVPKQTPFFYRACRRLKLPVVQTLHNYRLVCPQGVAFRSGGICDQCVGHDPWPAVRYRCYRGSLPQSMLVASVIAIHRHAGTWRDAVDAYITPSEFGRALHVRGGLPAERIYVRPNAVFDPAVKPDRPRDGAVFVGRIAEEKGVRVLLDAWAFLGDIPLTVVGDGPLRLEMESLAQASGLNVRFSGTVDNDQAREMVANAGVLVFPTLMYETLGMVTIEALASRTPIVASGLGPVSEVLRGVAALVRPGDAVGLAQQVRNILSSRALADDYADRGRARYEERYSPERSYEALMGVYETAIRTQRGS